ncbi:MAG: hypothetical protein Q8N18_07750 [Opitutaceae bacterium]|nr:hypothetical protein [Opitutaceae bacterium]
MPAATAEAVAAFIARWAASSVSERANYALFLAELCDVLEVPRPDPAGADTEHNAYVFERAVPLHQRDGKSTTGRIDLYKRGCFVLEAKQYAAEKPAGEPAELALDATPARKPKIARGSEAWDDAMLKARGQAERYARNLPAGEPTPPFLLVVDVGHVFELYADFSQQGKAYLPFPDPRANRIRLADLRDPAVRARLRALWLDPFALDPSKIAAAVTREVAGHLAELAKSFERRHEPKDVAAFLSRCLFCMFAEDVGLLPADSFKQLLDSAKADPGAFVPLLQLLFEDMNEGRFSGLLKKKLLCFNGGLFAEARALPVDGTQLGLLRRAAACEWRHVEPAIFGTLLERALHPAERHKLGAHYTPRAYVERLVLPTVVEPLREEWSQVSAAAITLANRGDLKAAIRETRAFHHRLCAVRVLDPACGSGNFLYVALEHLKRLEGEVLVLLEGFGENMRLDLGGETVDPHQFLGLELNVRAAAVAELVLWIGYLQWHHRNRGATEWPEPVLRAFKNIECRDAVLAYDKKEFATDAHGATRFVWDRKTMKTDPVTGRAVPDEKAVIPLETFVDPHKAEWPQADFIVGNPPFLGTARMREDLGDGYTETLRKTYPAMPESADFVMFWWHKAALEVLAGRARRFGFITTNSIRQTFNRRVVQAAMDDGLYLTFAIPDHPWVESSDGAAVRIAMSVGASSLPKIVGAGLPRDSGDEPSRRKAAPTVGQLQQVTHEEPDATGENAVQLGLDLGAISPDFTTGTNVAVTLPLKANDGLTYRGMMLFGDGFIITPEQAKALGLGKVNGLEQHIRSYRNGRDLTDTPRDAMVIDLFGLTSEEVRTRFPKVYEHVLKNVKPDRDQNREPKIKENWWLFGRPRPELRPALVGLRRYIATVETAKHRIFQFLDAAILPDNKLVVIALEDAFQLGVASSRIHATFALSRGALLEDRPVYPKTECFDPFPFPDCTEKQKEKIRALAEELDAHRKRAQAQHGLGLTDIYNVLEKVRGGDASPRRPEFPASTANPGRLGEPSPPPIVLTAKEKLVHDRALVSTLRQLHDDLDAAVAAAYGWPWPLTEAEILGRVVALNAARAAEEARGLVRWLRPDYQQPLFAGEKQSALGLEEAGTAGGASRPGQSRGRKSGPKTPPSKPAKSAWPASLAERVRAVELALAAEASPATAATLAARFARAKAPDILDILHTLVTLGRARPGDEAGTFVR